jgi:hypothetical protein
MLLQLLILGGLYGLARMCILHDEDGLCMQKCFSLKI